MELTEEEVREILELIDRSNFDFFELETGSLKLSVAKAGYRPATAAPAGQPTPPAARSAPSPPPPSVAALRPGLVAVQSPMVGTFYAGPNPGAAPFVEKGARVEPGTTVGLVEVMKVFTAVAAGSAGVIAEILVADGQSVEYGQPLFGIDPAP